MFEDLENNPILNTLPTEPEALELIRKNLSHTSPSFVNFVEKFGRVDVGYGHFVVYGWIEDLNSFFSGTLGVEEPGIEAWIFGDNYSGEFAAIDKKTGEVIEISPRYMEPDEIKYDSFEIFIRERIGK